MASAIAPKDEEAIREYLINAKVKGIGPKRVDKLLDHFGDQTLNVIAKESERLRELPGFGESKIQKLKAISKGSKSTTRSHALVEAQVECNVGSTYLGKLSRK